MKKTLKRAISSLLLTAMLASLAACGGDAAETTAAVTTAAPVANDGPTVIVPDMPDDLRFDGGKVRIACMEYIVVGATAEQVENNEASALGQEVYEHHKRVEERFGVTLEFTDIPDWATNMPTVIRQDVNSGSNEFDVVFSVTYVTNGFINEGLCMPITELEWIDLEKPWWNKGYIESVSLSIDNPYILFGSMTENQVERITCVYANTTKLNAQHNIIAEDLFELVMNGDWTLDKFTELVNMGYKDENGNTKADPGDMFGLIGINTDFLAYSSGLEFTTRDEFGYPVININNERSVDLAEKLVSLLFGNKNVLNAPSAYPGVGTDFASCTTLFKVERLWMARGGQVRDMKDDFIILPMPKFDDSVDGYHSTVGQNVQWGSVLTTVKEENLEMISAVLEQWAYDAYNKLIPFYYENELKLKYTRGDDIDTQSRVIDMIVEGARTDYLYVNNIGEIGRVFSHCVECGQNVFASYYASREGYAKMKLDQAIKSFEKRVYG